MRNNSLDTISLSSLDDEDDEIQHVCFFKKLFYCFF